MTKIEFVGEPFPIGYDDEVNRFEFHTAPADKVKIYGVDSELVWEGTIKEYGRYLEAIQKGALVPRHSIAPRSVVCGRCLADVDVPLENDLINKPFDPPLFGEPLPYLGETMPKAEKMMAEEREEKEAAKTPHDRLKETVDVLEFAAKQFAEAMTEMGRWIVRNNR